MFTGIVEEVGSIRAVQDIPGQRRLTIRAPKITQGAAHGDSIAVNGVCLTVADTGPENFTADLMPETLGRSTLGRLRQGDAVNLERALRLGARLGGHLVQGHVHATAGILGRDRGGRTGDVLHVELPPDLATVVIEKGSVTVDGVSLTVIAAGGGEFTVGLIPTTLAETTLGQLGPGDRVNLEPDPVASHVARCVERLIAAALATALCLRELEGAARAPVPAAEAGDGAGPGRLSGVVVRGDGRGHDLGFPTANLFLPGATVLPPDGVYAGWLLTTEERLPAAVSVGANVTFGGAERRIEAHVIDHPGLDLYGHRVWLELVRCLRPMRRFACIGDLQASMVTDVEQARAALAAPMSPKGSMSSP